MFIINERVKEFFLWPLNVFDGEKKLYFEMKRMKLFTYPYVNFRFCWISLEITNLPKKCN